MTDAELRDIYTRALTSRAAGRGECPSPEALDALVAKVGSEDARLATLDHVMSCNACRQEFELLRSIQVAASADARVRSRWRAPWLVAAAVVIAAGAVTLTRVSRPNPMRGASPAGAGQIALVGLAGDALVWRAVPGAIRYEVETVDASGATMFHATTTDTSVGLPPNALGVNWWVRATLRDGTERRSAVVPVR
jgi:hypothetical protein